jgi:hypothetical protein
VARLPHRRLLWHNRNIIWLGKCRIDCQVDLVPAGLEIAVLTDHQSGIESCRGLFIGSNPLRKVTPTQPFNKHLMRFGVSQPVTPLRAIYRASRHTGTVFRLPSGELSSRHRSPLRPMGRPLKRGGTLGRQEFYSEPMPREPFSLRFRYRSLSKCNHDSGRSL